ncbi:hypothetical protein DFS34DRAFT_225343 [Phlyctochytrium arcticum]|nr:hypothetical protein DFS34DRAFT_225343 [Phlyctochytrium arcticum]
MIEELPSEDQTMESRKDTEWQTLASVLGDNHLFIPNSTLDTLLEMHPVDLIQVGATSNLTQVTFRFRVLKTAGSRVSAPSEEASVSLWKMPAVKASAIAESVTNGESVVDTEDEEVLMGGVVQSVGELSSAPATPVPAKATPIIEKATSVPTSPTRPNVPAPIPEKITQVTPVAQAIPPIEKSVIYSPPTKIRRTSTSPKKKAETEPLPSTVKPTPKSTHDNAAVQDVSAPAPVVTGQESGQSTPRITSPAPVEESIEEFATDAAVAMDIGEPTSMILHTDPETGRPKLDDPVNGHWFNFRFGESIEAFSLSPVPGWYRARTLYYSPSGDSDWRVKIHYSRYPKQFDETIVLNEEGRGRLRPPSSELVGEGDGEEDERVFDPNSSAKKLYAISAKERELAKQGIMIVRRR